MSKLRSHSSPDHSAQLPQASSGQSRERSACAAWQDLLSDDRVIVHAADVAPYSNDTSGESAEILGLLRPQNTDEVAAIVEIAHQYRQSLYPISTGHNWGYGTANPAAADCWLLDLSQLRHVQWIDRTLGLVSVEPGVTQQQLYDFLQAEASEFMVPVHGGGPDCSLLGNALERGYGLTPTCDHFLALTALDAILADGTRYRSPLSELPNPQLQGYRWGIGPYLDGLFSQGNFGVVTRATLALEKRPEHVETFFVRIPDAERLSVAIDGLRELAHSLPGAFVGVNLMNARRVLSMSIPYPVDAAEGILSPATVEQYAQAGGVSAWTIAGVMHCPQGLKKALRKQVKQCLRPTGQRITFMNQRRLDVVRRLKFLPVPNRRLLLRQIDSIQSLLNMATGKPSRVAMPLAYWLNPSASMAGSNGDKQQDPARDRCGLIWYSPLVPAQSDKVDAFSRMVERVCAEHQIEPLITLTMVSSRMYDATVPLLFDPNQPGASQRAKACYQQLLEAGEQLGVYPYRIGLSAQRELAQAGKFSSWSMADRLRMSLDPFGIIAPGRYSTDPRNRECQASRSC